MLCKLTPCTEIKNEVERIDRRLDQEIQHVQMLLQKEKRLDHSLINNDLVYLYNEMLTFSYSLKLWLLNGLDVVMSAPEEFLITIRMQFEIVLKLVNYVVSAADELSSGQRTIQHYQRLDQAM